MTLPKVYGGIARQDRIGTAENCDKAWHLTTGEPVAATAVLRCADCLRVYARCAQCNRGHSTVQCSMSAHQFSAHRSPRARVGGGK